jgi:carbon storage regulator
MLVLSRRKNESVIIGDNIEIIIADICRGKIRLGINAPKEVPVHRKEIYEEIQAGADKKSKIL